MTATTAGVTPAVAVSAPALGPVAASAAPPEPTVKFEFDAFFQHKIAALAARDIDFMRRTDGLIKPEYFENANEAILVRIATQYFTKYKRLPADPTIYRSLILENVEAKVIQKELMGSVVRTLIDLLKTDVSDREYVVEQVSTFAKHQAVAAAFAKSIPKLDTRDFAGIAKLMQAALDVGAHVDTNEYDYGKMLSVRTGDRLSKAAGKLPPQGITTGYPKFDAAMYHSGWGRRELAVLMGGPKSGKTTAMMDFGINALASKFNVLAITLEVSKEIYSTRMDSNIAERAMFELGAHIHDVNDKVKAFMAKAGKFSIFEYPTGTMTVTDLRRLIERQKGKGIVYDLVIVDYADLMQPDRYTDSTTENSKSVYVGLRGLAMQENIAILTATQTNRVGSTATTAKSEHVSDDFNKVRIADLVISINRTDEEKAKKEARMYFAISRNSPAGFTLRIAQELDRMKFISKVLGEE